MGQLVLHAKLASCETTGKTGSDAAVEVKAVCLFIQESSSHVANYLHISSIFTFFLFTLLDPTDVLQWMLYSAVLQFLLDLAEGATTRTRTSRISFSLSPN